MNSKFDELAKTLAQTTTRRPGRSKYGWPLLGLTLALQSIASAQTLVPIIVIRTNQTVAVAGGSKSDAIADEPGATLSYVNSSHLVYPTILPGTTLAGPAGPDVQVNDPSLDNIQTLTTWKWPIELATASETTLAADGSNIVVSYNSSADQLIVKDAGNNDHGPFSFAYRYYSVCWAVSPSGPLPPWTNPMAGST